MRLYLLRHGRAAAPKPGQHDRSRVLTSAGVRQMEQQALAFQQAGFEIDRLLCSPYVRAQQTAEVVAFALGVSVTTEALLASGCTPNEMAEVLQQYNRPERVMVVGHQPELGQVVHLLTGSNAAIHPGTLAVIDVSFFRQGGGILYGLYDPEVMARVGHG